MHKKIISNNNFFYRLLGVKVEMNIFVIWFVLVIAWNFGYPGASPLEDVLVAVILALFNLFLKKYLKL
ncbi:hypothetical protein N9U27_01930 [Candidatus Pelagibacter sp.]|nr:hypothetical protein [Candidatus Pelagibacter sp.]